MDDRTISDAGQQSPQSGSQPRPAKPPSGPENVYGATFADGGVGSTAAGDQGERRGGTGDKYRVVHLIGKGGMGTVNLAQDVRLNRWVALKRLSEQFAEDSRLLQRFHTEAQSVGSLAHFHIVQVYAMDEDSEGPYIAMEYVAGPEAGGRADWPAEAPNPPLDLDELVKAKGALDLAKTVGLGIKLCSAVKYAHKRGVIHRDIKPANILFNEDWEPKLADFGLARQVNTQQEGATLAGAQLLTLGYGAPEQEVDASKVDQRADIYGMGGTLWFALSGQNPRFFRESEVPEVLRTVLAKALHKDREKRYQTAAEFEQALAGLDSRLKQAPAVEAPDQSKKAADDEAQAVADRVATLRSESRYQEAINTLRAMTLSVDPNQRGLSKWAEMELPVVQQEYAAAQKKRDEAIRQANEWMKAGKFAEAVNLLEEIPYAFHNPELADLLDRAKNVLGQAQTSMQAIAQLRQEIKDQIASKNYEGLRPKAERLRQLAPHDPSVEKLLQQLDKHEAHQQELAWNAVHQAPSPEGYRSYLSSYPNGPHAAEARATVGPSLRELVTARPDDRALRGEYLAARDGDLLKRDEQTARRVSMFAGVVGGAVAGAVLGLAVGALAGPIGGLVAGAIGGIAVGAILQS